MSKTVRQRIVDAIVAELKTVTVANGFQTDAGQSVFVWLPVTQQKLQLPSLNLRDISEDVSNPVQGQLQHVMTCEVVGVISSGTTTHESARLLLADVLKAINNGGDQRWRDPAVIAIQTNISKTEMLVEQEERTYGAVRVEFLVTYKTKQGDPFSLT